MDEGEVSSAGVRWEHLHSPFLLFASHLSWEKNGTGSILGSFQRISSDQTAPCFSCAPLSSCSPKQNMCIRACALWMEEDMCFQILLLKQRMKLIHDHLSITAYIIYNIMAEQWAGNGKPRVELEQITLSGEEKSRKITSQIMLYNYRFFLNTVLFILFVIYSCDILIWCSRKISYLYQCF